MRIKLRNRVAGLSIGGGRHKNVYLCLLEYFDRQDRWFLKSIHHVKEESGKDGDKALKEWATSYRFENIIVDFPQTYPPCHQCKKECPGEVDCPVDTVKSLRAKINELLFADQLLYDKDPKQYEISRRDEGHIGFESKVFDNPTILSRAFKRRLKKGMIPYWHRDADVYILFNYYDLMLQLFNQTYDSFGQTSQMLIFRMSYLRRQLPSNLKFFEGNFYICLIELLRKEIISKANIIKLTDMDFAIDARLEIIRKIEQELKIFIYDKDIETIIKSQKAFQSFILTVIGHNLISNKVRVLPSWVSEESRLAIPIF